MPGKETPVRITVQRREFLNAGSIGILAASLLRRAPAARAEAGAHSSLAKVVFVLFRRADLSHEQCLATWKGEQHVSIVKKVPGLRRWVQNHVASLPLEGAADGIGELWFDDAATRKQGMESSQMAAAVDDAKRFLDMTRSYALVVDEHMVIP
jgi:uncharacterized protein (TIGR02118 family)